MRRISTLAMAVSVALVAVAAPAMAQTTANSLVTVVHGIPGAIVDVYVNGDLFLEDFEPEAIAGPAVLPAASYEIAIYAADADPTVDQPLIDAPGVQVPAGIDAAVVAHLDADGNPTASVFVNDTSQIAPGQARVTLRHAAQAPEVDVLADGQVDLTPEIFENGSEAVSDVPAAAYQATVTAPGDPGAVLASLGEVTLAEGVNTTIYAIGTYTGDDTGTFTVISDGIAGLGPNGAFDDDNGSVHEPNIDLIARVDVTKGCNSPADREFCPTEDLTRGELAAFLTRALGLPASATDYFADDDGTTFETDINALAQAGITTGRDNGTYGANEPVTRGQMAAFLNRAFVSADAHGSDSFADDDGSIFEADIEAIAAARITVGCNPPENTEYCPERHLTRAEMATFLARALGLGS